MNDPALPGFELARTATRFDLSQPRQPRRQPNPYQHLDRPHDQRSIRATHCPKCRRPIVVGVDADDVAELIRAEATPLSALGEMLTLLAGMRTITLEQSIVSNPKLNRRTARRIPERIAEHPQRPWHQYDVLPIHDCASPTPPSFLGTTMLAPPTTSKGNLNEPAPF